MAHASIPCPSPYIETRPDHLWVQPPKHEESFSTPRSWHMLSDALKEYGDRLQPETLDVLATGCLSPHHAGQFKAQLPAEMDGRAELHGERASGFAA
ncbi:hypothetical protein [Paenibacillus stellifer]|uniref:hypothetical protein n=1 Tax=Paenibacillus stellifer TaxID=169760 RepID=UPI001FDEF185|nr:hypothetical protein [Paenibacillus stellifer]